MKHKISVGCLSAIVIALLMPIIWFGCGFVAGFVLELLVGNAFVDGLNLIFNDTRFTADMLPILCGTLSVIGSFFKTSVNFKD